MWAVTVRLHGRAVALLRALRVHPDSPDKLPWEGAFDQKLRLLFVLAALQSIA